MLDSKIIIPEAKCLPDIVEKGLQVVFCGLAPGNQSTTIGHHYAHPGNRFWSTLYETGFLNKPILPSKDAHKQADNKDYILRRQVGITDFIIGQCGNDDELNLERAIIKQARYRLMLFIIRWQPKYLAFNGKQAAKLYLGVDKIDYGLQSSNHDIGDTRLYVLPSTSPSASRWWTTNKHYWADLMKLGKG
ncbi:MAG: mismatch-specific DNA-glycosylase [bacterium]|nr:mismatch-specific DNA-glycosylase [bacterium]